MVRTDETKMKGSVAHADRILSFMGISMSVTTYWFFFVHRFLVLFGSLILYALAQRMNQLTRL